MSVVIASLTGVDFGLRASATTFSTRSLSVTMPSSFLVSWLLTIGIEPTSSDFINCAAWYTVSVVRQQLGFFVIISLHFMSAVSLLCNRTSSTTRNYSDATSMMAPHAVSS